MRFDLQRRELITLLGGAVLWPFAPRAQQQSMPVVGFLSSGSPEADAFRLSAVQRGLKEIGYVEGQNVAIEYRGARSQYDHLPALAVDLLGRQVNVIVTIGIPATLAAKAATNTIPIVFAMGADPVQHSLVSGLNRRCRLECGWNLRVAISSDVKLSDCRFAFKQLPGREGEPLGSPLVSFSRGVRYLSTPLFERLDHAARSID
jgi:ABC-type uncharacterized transport system substrate-binding protein